ncbi:MAG TPA: cell division protein FtsZ [Thermoanaerobaculia bacterium]|nr:cell division protein FtsZ [Thermoanaerobaculia bacterium]HUM29352.1 cell division protein FtsZ [Thermoanaerobaculia bacterium]HXK67598.1 cell division protein FtsZ [Thermoanaerobaculia bacterium]
MIMLDDQPPKQLAIELEENVCPAKIKVIGVGGGGGNAINRMIRSGIKGVEFIAVNTDLQDLKKNLAPTKIQIGAKLTQGLGTGGDPTLGREAAMEDMDTIMEHIEDADMVFLTSGMGGGTGTGALPQIAMQCRQLDRLLTVAVVTLPFSFELKLRARRAQDGLGILSENVDTLINIPNDRLLELTDRNTLLSEAFAMADDVLRHAVQGISDLIVHTGTINLDFNDVRNILKGQGKAIMGIGEAVGDDRAVVAAKSAISSPLLTSTTIEGAKSILINFSGRDLKLMECSEACKLIEEMAHEDAEVMWGVVEDETLAESIKITVFATGFDGSAMRIKPKPVAQVKPGPIFAPVERPAEDRAVVGGNFQFASVAHKEEVEEETVAQDELDLEKPTWMRKGKKKLF